MTTNAPPSGNPADRHHLRGVMRMVLNKFLQRTDDMLPAKIISYDPTTNLAQVQPMIMVVTTDNQAVNRARVASVPVYQASGGGFILKFPVNPGDFGWIKANDRDISLFMQTGAMSPPNTQRKHTFMDALFIPQAFFNLVTIAEEDTGNVVLQNYDGTVKISMWSDLIKILAPAGVGIGGTPNAHAILDLQSTTQAFIMPRMTTSQRDAIPSPVEGMEIWNLDVHGSQSYNGSAWG